MARPNQELTLKQRKYAKGIIAGKTKTQAALDAGYSPNTAIAASQNLDRPIVKKEIEKALRKAGVTTDKIAEVLSDGLKANKIHSSHTEPDTVVPDHSVRHKFLETAIKLKGFDKETAPAQQVNFFQLIQQQSKDYE